MRSSSTTSTRCWLVTLVSTTGQRHRATPSCGRCRRCAARTAVVSDHDQCLVGEALFAVRHPRGRSAPGRGSGASRKDLFGVHHFQAPKQVGSDDHGVRHSQPAFAAAASLCDGIRSRQRCADQPRSPVRRCATGARRFARDDRSFDHVGLGARSLRLTTPPPPRPRFCCNCEARANQPTVSSARATQLARQFGSGRRPVPRRADNLWTAASRKEFVTILPHSSCSQGR